MRTADDLFVLDCSLGDQFDNVCGTERTDQHFKSAVEILGPAAGLSVEIVTADFRSPAVVTHQSLKAETGEMMGQLLQAVFDMVGQIDPAPGVKRLQLFLTHGLLSFLSDPDVAILLPANDRFFQTLLEIHEVITGVGKDALQREPTSESNGFNKRTGAIRLLC